MMDVDALSLKLTQTVIALGLSWRWVGFHEQNADKPEAWD